MVVGSRTRSRGSSGSSHSRGQLVSQRLDVVPALPLLHDGPFDTLLKLQLENAIPVVSIWKVNLAIAFFADGGVLLERHKAGVAETAENSKAALELRDDLHLGLGAGLRIVIPGIAIPAVKIDWAYGVDVRDHSVVIGIASGGL